MRFLKFFLPVFVVLFGCNVTPANAILNQEPTQQQVLSAIRALKDEVIPDEHAADRDDNAKQTEELSTGRVASDGLSQQTADANNLNAAALEQQASTVDTFKRHMNRDDYICSLVSMQQDLGKTFENSDLVGDELRKERNASYFKNSDKGIKEFSRTLYKTMKSLPNERVDIGELFFNPVVPVSGTIATNLDYLEKLLFQRVPVHLLEDIKAEPGTDAQSTLIMGDRIAAESRIGSTTLSMLQGMHAPTPGVGAAEWIKEVMTENGYTPDYIQKQLNGGSPSKYGILKALAIGQVGQKYGLEKFMTTPENYDAAILFQIMVGNMLLFEQYNLLQTIAMSTATNVIAVREEAIKDVNSLVQQENSR